MMPLEKGIRIGNTYCGRYPLPDYPYPEQVPRLCAFLF